MWGRPYTPRPKLAGQVPFTMYHRVMLTNTAATAASVAAFVVLAVR